MAVAFIFAVVLVFVVFLCLFPSIGRITVIIEAQKCYAICFGGFSTAEKAKSYAKIIVERGGAGYVVNKDEYFVVACTYAQQRDAQSVYKNLTEAGETVRIITLETDTKSIDLVGSKDDVQMFHKCVDFIKETFIALNNLAIRVDKSNGEEQIYADLKVLQERSVDINEKLVGDKFGRIKQQITKLVENLTTVSSDVTAAALRYAATSAFLSIGEI